MSEERGEKAAETAEGSKFEAYERHGALSSAMKSVEADPPPQSVPPSVSTVSFSFARTQGATPVRKPAIMTPRKTKVWERKQRLSTRSAKGKKHKKTFGSLASFGMMHEEALLHRDDPRKSDRRQNDSDLDWGDEDSDEEGAHVGSKARTPRDVEMEEHGMDVDPDIGDLGDMKRFVDGMIGSRAGVHASFGDLDDEEMIKAEDEEEVGESSGSDEEDDDEDDSEDEKINKAIEEEEAMMVSENLEFEIDADDSDDDDPDITPRRSFQDRLARLREKSRTIHASGGDVSIEMLMDDDNSDDDEDEDYDLWLAGKAGGKGKSKADSTDDYIAQIEKMFGENGARVYEDEDSDDYAGFKPAPRRRDKGKHLPADLRALWEKDRQKKAEFKKQRELAKLLTASDPLAKKKGGRKGKKAMLLAASMDPTIKVLPNRIMDMTTLVQQIRRFIDNIGGPNTMSLPPSSKETRKQMHEIALAFGLKSVSKGKGEARYTTLTKTTRSIPGGWVDERKIAKVVRRSAADGGREYVNAGRGPGGGGRAPRHREGDIVGHAAPKIGEANIGFKMLAQMGWAEGNQIGIGKGIAAPLTAVIKTTKLGLGATM